MEPDKHVEIKPVMAQHNCADNTGLECCWSTKTRYIYFSLNFLYFSLSYSRRSHNSRGNERRWNLRNNGIVSDPYWPMRIKLEQSESYYFARKLPTPLSDWWTSLVHENFVSSSSVKNIKTKTHWVLVIECAKPKKQYLHVIKEGRVF